MKILHTADWHIGQFKGPVVDGVNLRSQDTVKCLEYMVQVAIEEKPDIVCVSGDIFHQEQVGPVRYSDEMITATNIITSLAHFSKYVIVMRGTPNHDGAAQFRVLERMLLNIRNVDVVTEPGVIKTPWADIACLPGFDKQEFRAKFPGLSADEENLAWTKYISDMVFALRAECEKTPILMAHYELGAFYVADIEAESTIDITNRGLLSEESDPRLNLKKWLEEKTFKNPDKIVELAEPIIAEAMKQSTTAEIHGVFKPVSISVRNYRNYKEESFDFSDISFCTINGVRKNYMFGIISDTWMISGSSPIKSQMQIIFLGKLKGPYINMGFN